jgi:ribosomal protein L23
MVQGRARNFRGRSGQRAGWKKAFVKLKDGFEINFIGGE